MVRYEVILDVDPRAAAALEHYMRERHIPEIFATACFAEIRFDRLVAPEARGEAGAVRFRTTYHAARREDLDRYLTEHTARLRADFEAHVGESATVARAVWDELERWPRENPMPAR
jgi:Domain of unknown function (DUF4286)